MTIAQLQQFLMWCSIINLGLLVFSFLMVVVFREWVCKIHASVFRIPEDSVREALYGFIGNWKILTFLFFVVPWLALYLVE